MKEDTPTPQATNGRSSDDIHIAGEFERDGQGVIRVALRRYKGYEFAELRL